MYVFYIYTVHNKYHAFSISVSVLCLKKPEWRTLQRNLFSCEGHRAVKLKSYVTIIESLRAALRDINRHTGIKLRHENILLV